MRYCYRLLLAFVLIGAVTLVSPMLFRHPQASATEVAINGIEVARLPVAWVGSTSGDGVVVIAISSFTPPEADGVEFAVTIPGPDGGVEIGRFTLFPQTAFVATNTADDRRFAITIPARFGRIGHILVRMVPFGSTGKGARAVFRSAEGSTP